MSDVTATDAARHFSDLLDAVEHKEARFTIVRRGRAVARLEPIAHGRGAEIKDILRRRRPDDDWANELAEVRELVEIEERH